MSELVKRLYYALYCESNLTAFKVWKITSLYFDACYLRPNHSYHQYSPAGSGLVIDLLLAVLFSGAGRLEFSVFIAASL